MEQCLVNFFPHFFLTNSQTSSFHNHPPSTTHQQPLLFFCHDNQRLYFKTMSLFSNALLSKLMHCIISLWNFVWTSLLLHTSHCCTRAPEPFAPPPVEPPPVAIATAITTPSIDQIHSTPPFYCCINSCPYFYIFGFLEHHCPSAIPKFPIFRTMYPQPVIFEQPPPKPPHPYSTLSLHNLYSCKFFG
jgi:hypothetical protein